MVIQVHVLHQKGGNLREGAVANSFRFKVSEITRMAGVNNQPQNHMPLNYDLGLGLKI
jgi:hypothetical protein